MGNMPWHPAVGHLPLGLAFMTPLLAIGLTWAIWRDWLPKRSWWILVVFQALLVGAGLVTIKTGENEEDRVEKVVAERFIHEHEEAAEQFVWGAGIVLALAAGALLLRRPQAQRRILLLAVAGTIVVAGLALRAGLAGGELVYVHGAAASYTTEGAAQAPDHLRGAAREQNPADED